MKFDLIETTALASLLLLFGYRARATISILHRLNIPPPVIGGLTMSIIVLIHRTLASTPLEFDTTLQRPLMIAFFTSIGFGASYRHCASVGRRSCCSCSPVRSSRCCRTFSARVWR